MSQIYCANCGQQLTEANITLAMVAIGGDIPSDSVTFYCPSYEWDAGICPGYAQEDSESMAHWATSAQPHHDTMDLSRQAERNDAITAERAAAVRTSLRQPMSDYAEARAQHTGENPINFVTSETTQGYNEKQLQELNGLILSKIAAHLMDSLYDDDGFLDIDGWIADDPNDFQSLCERVIKDYDTQIS